MAKEIIDVMIESVDEIVEYYPDGNLNWVEIASNFALSNKFIEDNIEKFDAFDKANELTNSEESSKVLLLMNQSLSTSFLLRNIKYFDVDLVVIYQEIEDSNLIDELKELKKISEKQLEEELVIQDEIIDTNETIEEKEKAIIIPVVEKIIEPKKEIIEEKVYVNTQKTFTKPIIPNKGYVDVEQLSIDRLRELDVDFNSIVGMHLSKVYVGKFNELKKKYEASISQFENLILNELSAKA